MLVVSESHVEHVSLLTRESIAARELLRSPRVVGAREQGAASCAFADSNAEVRMGYWYILMQLMHNGILLCVQELLGY